MLYLKCNNNVSQKVPTFKFDTDFQNFYTAGKRMKFAIRNVHSFPPHLDYVATLPWEVKSPILLKITKDIYTTQKLYRT